MCFDAFFLFRKAKVISSHHTTCCVSRFEYVALCFLGLDLSCSYACAANLVRSREIWEETKQEALERGAGFEEEEKEEGEGREEGEEGGQLFISGRLFRHSFPDCCSKPNLDISLPGLDNLCKTLIELPHRLCSQKFPQLQGRTPRAVCNSYCLRRRPATLLMPGL